MNCRNPRKGYGLARTIMLIPSRRIKREETRRNTGRSQFETGASVPFGVPISENFPDDPQHYLPDDRQLDGGIDRHGPPQVDFDLNHIPGEGKATDPFHRFLPSESE